MANEYLSAAHLTKIGTDVGLAISGLGSTASISVTYSRVTATSYAPTTGAATDTKADTTVTAYRYEFFSKLADGTERAMIAYMISVASLANEPCRDDRITEGSNTYHVQEWSTDPLRKFWIIQCPKAAT